MYIHFDNSLSGSSYDQGSIVSNISMTNRKNIYAYCTWGCKQSYECVLEIFCSSRLAKHLCLKVIKCKRRWVGDAGVYVACFDIEAYANLNNITSPQFVDLEEVDLLIGQDNTEALLSV